MRIKFFCICMLVMCLLCGCSNKTQKNGETTNSEVTSVNSKTSAQSSVSDTPSEETYETLSDFLANLPSNTPPTQEEMDDALNSYNADLQKLRDTTPDKVQLDLGDYTFDSTDTEIINEWIDVIQKMEVTPAERSVLYGVEMYVLVFHYGDETIAFGGIRGGNIHLYFNRDVMLVIDNISELNEDIVALEEKMGYDRNKNYTR